MITQLRVARTLVRAYFDPPTCGWQGRYHQRRSECNQCADEGVCRWLFEQEPEPDLAKLTATQLVQTLVFATGFLEGSMLKAGHESAKCGCAVCTFVRANHEVLKEH